MVQLAKLQDNDYFERQLQDFIEEVAKDEDFGYGKDSSESHRKQRVEKFFAALIWAASADGQKAGNSHLMFLNSFSQIKFVLDNYSESVDNLFAVSPRESIRWFDVYDLDFLQQKFTLVFYDAQQARKIKQITQAQTAFDSLFQEDRIVVVITQYLSAGNGVNLQYQSLANNPQKSDFLNLHLLEAPYFYFGNPDKAETIAQKISILKENIWYQAKLYASKYIGEGRFKQVLGSLHSSQGWNNHYQIDASTGADALLNNMATFIQAIGRIERTWSFTPKQNVILAPEVYGVFQLFLTREEFSSIRQERQPMLSTNLRQVFEQIEAQIPLEEREIKRRKDESLVDVDRICAQQISKLVDQLRKVRSNEEKGKDVRQRWQHLRQAVLRHDFRNQLLAKYNCVFESSLVKEAVMYRDNKGAIIPEDLFNAKLHAKIEFDNVYRVVVENEKINKHFANRGYEMKFNPSSHQFFTPYCYQAILAGAVGEEACFALLKAEDIKLEELPDELFEISDLKVEKAPIYIDCKNYSDFTMGRFSLPADDPLWHPKLNDHHFKERAQEKLTAINVYHGIGGKLIYLVLASAVSRDAVSDTSRSHDVDYYNRNFERVNDFGKAEIIVMQGCIDRYNPNTLQNGFLHLISDLRDALGKDKKEKN